MERFDKKDPDIHFRDLAQLKQTSSVETFISEFQRDSIMVSDISESRLIMLFTEALSEPLRGWVKAYRPITLQDAISRTLDLQDSVPKNKQPQKLPVVQDSVPKNKQPQKLPVSRKTRKNLPIFQKTGKG